MALANQRRRVQDYAIAGGGLDELLAPHLHKRLVRKEVHKPLEDTTLVRTFLLLDGDDAWSLYAEAALEKRIPDFHSSEDIHEAQAKVFLPADRVVNFLAIAGTYIRRYAA